MKILVDTHTHTIASGHAYSTIIENALLAEQNGLKLLCTTDHAPEMPGAPHFWHFNNLRILPRFLHNVGILRGVEVNIMDTEGKLDLYESSDEFLDWMIASFHEPTFPPATPEDHTQALINTIKTNRVDALGHLGNPNFPFDIETVFECAKAHNVAIEINNSSLLGNSRIGSVGNCKRIAEIGKEIGVYFTTGSDAHFAHDIGNLDLAVKLLESLNISEDKVITSSTERFLHFLSLRGRAPITEFSHLS